MKEIKIEIEDEKTNGCYECVNNVADVDKNVEIIDLTAIDFSKKILIDNLKNEKELLKFKEFTTARVGIGRSGSRYKTETMLRLRADHAAAMDTVFNSVSEDFLKDINLFTVQTLCKDKDEYLTRPDLGRKFGEETIKLLKEKCINNPQVQIFASDGLSSTAVEGNFKDIFPSILQGLEGYGIKVGTPFFVKYGRVLAMDTITEALGAEVTVVLIGERPGLVTAESMSAYMTYRGTVGMQEAKRTVLSNIHKGGTIAVEAGAYIADIIKQMLEQKASGLDLKL